MIERKTRISHCSRQASKHLSPSKISSGNMSLGNSSSGNSSENECYLPKTTIITNHEIAPHQLTVKEKNHIFNVLLKLEDIQHDENKRDRLVREEFCKSLDDLASTISEKSINSTVPNYTPNRYSCHICTEAIGKARSTVRKERNFLMCWDCKQFTCTLCSVNHYNGPFTTNNQYTNQRNVRLCKPCLYRREMSLRSGEWFYGAVGAQEVKNIHRSVIDSLGMPEEPSMDSKDSNNSGSPKWRHKAQKRISQTSLNTLKIMKRKWQVLAKFKTISALTDNKGGANECSSDDDASRFAEEIQEQYLAFKDSPAACKYAKKSSQDQSSTSSNCSRQWSRESSPERSSSSITSSFQLSSWSVIQSFPSQTTSPIRRNKSADNLVSGTCAFSAPLTTRSKNQVSMELARKTSKKGHALEKWRNTAGSCSNIEFNTVVNETSTKSASAVM